MDARSTGAYGPEAEDLFKWTPNKFERLLAYHNASSDTGGGVPVDTLFDAFLFVGYDWYGGKKFWPGTGVPMNKTDWLGILQLQLTMGAANLDIAATSMSERLPFPPVASCGGGLRPGVVLSVPCPDSRQQDFGAIDASGRSLNMSVLNDQIAATTWWVQEAHKQWQASNFSRVSLSGFYWFMEEIREGDGYADSSLVPSVSRSIKAISPGLMFMWIPYYRPGDVHTGRWKELGFDFATLQPNYAFNNVSAAERFPTIRQVVQRTGDPSAYLLGVQPGANSSN
jgi:hypothetical protein